MNEVSKETLKLIAIKQRIGELTSDYEERIADLRADITLEIEKFTQKLNELERENMDLKSRLGETNVVSSKEA
jgi:uncharacterized protein YeeX (DUF496 family)